MPPVEEIQTDKEPEKTEAPASKPVIGIIYPPPEVRNIVDKTASFVARNGPEFETRIRQNELNNPKFNFLNPADPYHAYYQHKVKEFKEGKGQEPAAPKGSLVFSRPPPDQAKIVEIIIPKDPPPEFEFIADPPSISAFDLDVVKLTAQFVARNGRQFLTNLMNREKNYQFDFLRPQHSLFNYFTKLVEQYTKVLIPPKDLLPKLRQIADNPREILDKVKYRVEWHKFQERERRKEEEALERERVAYAQIDWHDFVVVETVDFQPNEQGNLPPPTTSEEVGARVLAQERHETRPDDQTIEMDVDSSEEEDEEDEEEEEEDDEEEEASSTAPAPSAPGGAPGAPSGDDTQVQDMEEDSDEEGDEKTPAPPAPELPKVPLPPLPPPAPKDIPQPPPLPPAPDQVIVRKDYNPKAPKVIQNIPAPDEFLISPITGEKIPADKIQEHIKRGLLDPNWINRQGRVIKDKMGQEEVYAPGSAIGSNLKYLAERRTDIFGAGAEETQIGKKIGEEDKRVKEKVTWDGHTASMERVTQKARENISIEEQIAVIHKVKGLLPDEEKERIGPARPKQSDPPPLPPSFRPPAPSQPPPPPPMSAPLPPSIPAPPIPAPPPGPGPSGMGKPPGPPPPKPMQGPMRPPGPHPMVMHRGGPQVMMLPPRPPMVRPVLGLHPGQMRGPMPPGPPMGPHMGHGHQGFMPPHMGHHGPRHHGPPQPPQHPPDDEPPAKKVKTESQLIPEEEFLKRNKAPVMFRVQIPNMPDKPEWKLNGQMLAFTLPLTDSVSVIKAKLHEALGMPAGKQKLQFDGLFIKDSNTLAFYNFTRYSIVSLQLKERGGRKK